MSPTSGFRLPHVLLPRPGIDLRKWAVIACDQHTAEPAYWQGVAEEVGDAPSTLNLIFPEAYLEHADAPARIEAIQRCMRRYVDEGLFVEHHGTIYVERRIGARHRRGLMLELDLECYDFSPQSTSLIRPTEGTIVSRLAPRIAVRSGAPLELPHILVLIDDREGTVIEPVAAEVAAATAHDRANGSARPLYETELMLGGGHVTGYAVDAERAERLVRALQALGSPEGNARRYGLPEPQQGKEGASPMLFAVGDGNHSLATAKSLWERIKPEVGMDHPARWALVEVENIHDPALEFEPIHRLLMGIKGGEPGDVRAALRNAFGAKLAITEQPSAEAMRARLREIGAAVHARGTQASRQAAGLIGPGATFAVVEIADPPSSLAVGTLQPFIDGFVESGGASGIDYVHGDDVLERVAQQPGHVGLHIGTVSKSELLQRVVREGPLPRKTFSMGEADEKRFYVEARRIG